MSFPKCRELFRLGLLDALTVSESQLRTLIRGADQGLFPINGFALRILPWHNDAWIAFRVQSDSEGFNIDEWKHHDLFTYVPFSGPLAAASAFAGDSWNTPPIGRSSADIAHLIFLAAADALLDKSVIDKFYAVLGISDNASMYDKWFEYFVLDADLMCKANYCDIVLANRLAARVLPDWM